MVLDAMQNQAESDPSKMPRRVEMTPEFLQQYAGDQVCMDHEGHPLMMLLPSMKEAGFAESDWHTYAHEYMVALHPGRAFALFRVPVFTMGIEEIRAYINHLLDPGEIGSLDGRYWEMPGDPDYRGE